jgi:HD-GYP domain-containing protein (c-di-GMP phosphodiesterase class II)
MSTSRSASGEGGMVPVAVRTLLPSAEVQFDLYILHGEGGQPRLFRQHDYPFTQDDLEKLLERGIQTLYVSYADSKSYTDYLLARVVEDETIPLAKRYEVLREAARAVLTSALASKNVDRVVGATGDVAAQMVGTICNSNAVLFDIFELMAHDYGTFAHMMNASTYAVLLAHAFGISNQQELIEIGQGALLHDVGKLEISPKILGKRERLTEDETQIIKRHPACGFRKLSRRNDLSWSQLMMVYQHHERCDGRGYPANLLRSEIHEWARLCAIADVFDALTNDRSYRNAAALDDVLQYFDAQAGQGFDEEMVHCLIAAMTRRS